MLLRLMYPLDDPLPLFHGTSQETAHSVLTHGFREPVVADRLQALASRYDVTVDELAESKALAYVWHRNCSDLDVSLATSPRLAASYARRGSEINYFGLQTIFGLKVARSGESAKLGHVGAVVWAKAEIARAQLPAVIQLAIPLGQIPEAKVEEIARLADCPPELQQVMNGLEVTLHFRSPAIVPRRDHQQ